MPKKPEYVSAVQAATLTGLSEKTIRRKIKRGELKATKQGTSYQIRVKDLDKLTGQRPPTPDVLLQRIQELEEIQASQAERIATLEHLVQEREARSVPAEKRTVTGPLTTFNPVPPLEARSQREEPDEDRTPTQPLAAPVSLPGGSILAAHFADQIGVNRRTFNDQIRAGKVQVTTLSKGGRPEHWVTPDQQEAIKRQRGL